MEIMMHGHIFLVIFFEITQYNSDTHDARILTPLWTHIRKPYPMSIFEDWAGKSYSLPWGVEPRTSGATDALVTIRLQALSFFGKIFNI